MGSPLLAATTLADVELGNAVQDAHAYKDATLWAFVRGLFAIFAVQSLAPTAIDVGFRHGPRIMRFFEIHQNYPHYQKLVYGVYMATNKLKHYFQEHPIKVISEAPLTEIIGNKDATSRVAKWAINLTAHGVEYDKRTAIKSQVLADFLVDWTGRSISHRLPIPTNIGSCTSMAPKDTGDSASESFSPLPRDAG